jgi:hypothetical protein
MEAVWHFATVDAPPARPLDRKKLRSTARAKTVASSAAETLFDRGLLTARPRDRTLPSQSAACYALVGLLTSKLGSRGPSRRCTSRKCVGKYACDNGLIDWRTFYAWLQRRGRPGIAPGSLYVGPPTGAADHQRPIANAVILATDAMPVKRLAKKNRVVKSPFSHLLICRRKRTIPSKFRCLPGTSPKTCASKPCVRSFSTTALGRFSLIERKSSWIQ